MAKIARKVRQLRKDKGLTQRELADRAGILRPNIGRLEAGRHTPTLPTIRSLAKALEVSVFDLLEGEEN